MYKFNKNTVLLSIIIILFSMTSKVYGQSDNFMALKQDFPELLKLFGDSLKHRNAHYIFAVDVSSSMLNYEDVVRKSLIDFIRAIPDEDQITIIRMCDENRTNFIESIKCIKINEKARESIIKAIQSLKFLRPRDEADGSDGYTMAQKILEAMNVSGSSDITFVYMLTDFEYYTHKNKFDKSKENWSDLTVPSKHKDMMCKYGIELNLSNVKHPESIFKNELDSIFNEIDYQEASSPEILKQWFDHIINDTQAHKINAMLLSEWHKFMNNFNVILQWKERQLNALTHSMCSNIVDSLTITLNNEQLNALVPNTKPTAVIADTATHITCIGSYECTPTWYPSYVDTGGDSVLVSVEFHSKYKEEIMRLQDLCKIKAPSGNAISLNKGYALTTPSARIWNAKLQAWCYVLILSLILGVIASIIYTLGIHPERREISVDVTKHTGTISKQYYGSTMTPPFTIGNGCDMDIPGVNWRLKVIAKKYNPIITWCTLGRCSSGYYVKLETGDYAGKINNYSNKKICTISTGNMVLLFKYKKCPNAHIEISENNSVYNIEFC